MRSFVRLVYSSPHDHSKEDVSGNPLCTRNLTSRVRDEKRRIVDRVVTQMPSISSLSSSCAKG